MADSHFVRLVGARRKRLVASILGHAEREFYSQLTESQREDFRLKVLDSVDDFADLMRDIIKVTGEDVVVNAHVVDMIERIYAATAQDD